MNGLGFVALQEKNYEEAKRLFAEGIQSAEEFGRVDELAKGQLGLASVHLETNGDLQTALILVNEALEGFLRQGMQYEVQKSQALQGEILQAQSRLATPRNTDG